MWCGVAALRGPTPSPFPVCRACGWFRGGPASKLRCRVGQQVLCSVSVDRFHFVGLSNRTKVRSNMSQGSNGVGMSLLVEEAKLWIQTRGLAWASASRSMPSSSRASWQRWTWSSSRTKTTHRRSNRRWRTCLPIPRSNTSIWATRRWNRPN